jgi:phosphatidylglycerol:prolipoprotein diacylglycerol transferase
MNELTPKIWVHDLNPFLVRFSESVGLSWYGLAYLGGFVTGGLLLFAYSRRAPSTIKPEHVPGYLTAVVFGTLLGGRLGYAVLYSPTLLWGTTSSFPYWKLLIVWEGGMASHGGILGLVLASILYSHLHHLDWRRLVDLATLGGSIGIFFGRFANFINGELFGREASSALSWAVKFPQEILLWPKHDLRPGVGLEIEHAELPRLTQAVQHLNTVTPEAWQQWLSEIPSLPSQPQYIAQGLETKFHNTLKQIISAVQEGNQSVIDALSPHLTPRYPSQLVEAGLEGSLVLLAVIIFWRRPRKPGVVASFWLISYSLARIISEQFRLPDPNIGFQLFHLTRGQWLSLGTLFLGLLLFYVFNQASTPRALALKHLNNSIRKTTR